MSGKNSANKGSARSTNVSIVKARQDAESARQGAAGARESVESARQSAAGAKNRVAAIQNVNSANQISGAIPTPSGCRLSRDCAEGWACIDGTCIDMSGPGSDRIATPGDCALPEDGLAKNPCGKDGGCDKPTCGENLERGGIDCCGGTIYRGYQTVRTGTNPDTLEPITKEVWREQCEPIEYECDQYADFWYKATGDLLSGYEANQVCTSCNECGAGKICRPLSKAFAPCYCYPGVCQDKEGPCFECDTDTGDCIETCNGCVAECNQFFQCPCDPSGTRYEAIGSFNPCATGIQKAGCWESTAQDIKDFCAKNFECPDENQCIGDCETLKGSNGYPACPPGKTCKQNGFIQNAETGATTYFVSACNLNPDCGCGATPDSPLYQACGNCEICEDGECVPDPSCGYFETGDGAYYEIYVWDYAFVSWSCERCNGEPVAGAETPGGSCDTIGRIVSSFGGGFCDPGNPLCQPYGYPSTSGYSRSFYVYSDGSISASGGGQGTVSRPCNVDGGSSGSQVSKDQVGAINYERRVDVLYDPASPNYPGVKERLMAQYSEPLTVESGTSYSSRWSQESFVESTFQVVGMEIEPRFEKQPPLTYDETAWPPSDPYLVSYSPI